MQKAVFFWSGGKDSALCLYKVLQEKQYEVVALLTTVNSIYSRISMHGVREELLERQAEAIGIPLAKMYVSESTNSEYEQKMSEVLQRFGEQDVSHVIYGDIFLEDLRRYRDENLEKLGMTGVYPLWKKNTKELMDEFLSLGFRTITCCVNDACLGEDRAGAIVDADFIRTLPPVVDPCGENGEFHTFCFDGPLFSYPVPFEKGEKIYRPLEMRKTDNKCSTKVQTRGFWFCDLI